MEPIAVWRSAKLLIEHYGADGALLHAAQRSDELAAPQDSAGKFAWLAILRAVEELNRLSRSPGEPSH